MGEAIDDGHYTVISVSADGILIMVYAKQKLLKDLDEGAWGESVVFHDAIPGESDPNYWPKGLYVLDGVKCVKPFPSTVVTSWALP